MGATKSGLGQYKSKLSPAEVTAGINAANRNALRLAQDARLLFEADRFPSAAALAILSIEEAGKSSILRAMALEKTQAEIAADWKGYRRHTAKNAAWIFMDLFRAGARKLDDFAPLFDPDSDHADLLDQVKQIAFYTDCLGKSHWSIPDEVVDRALASSLLQIATVLARERVVTEREIDLWIEHIGPVWRGPKAWMENALIRWHEAMRDAGFEVAGSMEEFIRGTGRHAQARTEGD